MSTERQRVQTAICIHLIKRTFDRAYRAADIIESRHPGIEAKISVIREFDDIDMTSMEGIDQSDSFVRCDLFYKIDSLEAVKPDSMVHLWYGQTITSMVSTIEQYVADAIRLSKEPTT